MKGVLVTTIQEWFRCSHSAQVTDNLDEDINVSSLRKQMLLGIIGCFGMLPIDAFTGVYGRPVLLIVVGSLFIFWRRLLKQSPQQIRTIRALHWATVFLLATAGWYLSGGLLSPFTLCFSTLLAAVLVITPSTLHLRLIVFSFIHLLLLLTLELLFPTLIPASTKIHTHPYAEAISSLLFSFVFLGILVNHLKQQYDQAYQTIQSHNNSLQKANQELDRFVYSASHDLRAPIASVMGLIQVARMEKDSGQLSTYFDLQEQRLRKLDTFIQDIIHYSRNSRQALRPARIHFREQIELAFEMYGVADQGLTVEKIYTETVTPHDFHTDPGKLEVILNNLISNGFRYADARKERSFVKISVTQQANEVLLKVADNGVGIPTEHQARIFEMFYRANDQKPGSGLGLFIVKETVEKMQGSIAVESTPGQGTTFTVRLPNLPPTEVPVEEEIVYA
ncbi:sensor histidine kinase [Catalinimonas alkaloidigena]|uniref:sensor histidine kinase n=1 Tax=Catalinimonas alkaloidigena TaxID=1075417 RepID=UPI0015A2F863|nr:HAMP domain-containing sensor histidine kinase [Catalinimonas alkaloidigena]